MDVHTLQTTVAQLLARAMSELGFRTNDTMIETSAQEILKGDASDFADSMEQAKGGCLFIDEAYRFTPSPPGQQPNLSNQVLDYLLEAVEKPEVRSTTTVILAGYRDEIETLLAYNVGFASRFPIDFNFPDYNEVRCSLSPVPASCCNASRLSSVCACESDASTPCCGTSRFSCARFLWAW